MKMIAVVLVAVLALGGCCSARLPDCSTCPKQVERITQTEYVHEPSPELEVPTKPPITSAVTDAEAEADPGGYQSKLLADLAAWVAVALEAIGIIEHSNSTRPDPGGNGG